MSWFNPFNETFIYKNGATYKKKLSGKKYICTKNGKKISCKNKIFAGTQNNTTHTPKTKTLKSNNTKFGCYKNGKKMSCIKFMKEFF